MNRLILPIVLAACAIAAHAQSSCSSDGQKPPTALLERFINADCETCWADKQTPEPTSGAIALDWVAAGSKGEDAALAAVATRDGADRLESIGRKVPEQSSSVFTQRVPAPLKLRVAVGLPINDYIGTSIELRGGGPGPYTAWLLLVETLPAGSEGTPVERNLVRNAFSTVWKGNAPRQYELRPMRLVESVKPSRLRVVGWVEDAKGKIRAIAESRCRP